MFKSLRARIPFHNLLPAFSYCTAGTSARTKVWNSSSSIRPVAATAPWRAKPRHSPLTMFYKHSTPRS